MDLRDFIIGDLSSVNPLSLSLASYVVQIINTILQVWIENVGDCYLLCLMQNIQEPQNNFPGNIKIKNPLLFKASILNTKFDF